MLFYKNYKNYKNYRPPSSPCATRLSASINVQTPRYKRTNPTLQTYKPHVTNVQLEKSSAYSNIDGQHKNLSVYWSGLNE